jgi:fatty-acyl-CoA synthase
VLAHVGEHFARWQLPDEVIVVEALPMTATGKISKKDLRAKYRDVLMQQAQG